MKIHIMCVLLGVAAGYLCRSVKAWKFNKQMCDGIDECLKEMDNKKTR